MRSREGLATKQQRRQDVLRRGEERGEQEHTLFDML